MANGILKNFSILYAEDNIELQRAVLEYLERHFGAVYVADDGKEALEKYACYAPDVLLLDIDMPFVDGLSVAQEVRTNNEDIPIMILTAYTDTDKLLRATELNLAKYLVKSEMNSFLMKPIQPLAFQKAMQKIATILAKNSNNHVKLSATHIWEHSSKQLFINHKLTPLSPKEHTLLNLFIEHQGRCVTFEEIILKLWEDSFDEDISIDSVKQQVSLLRKKLPPNTIQNIYATGYTLLLS